MVGAISNMFLCENMSVLSPLYKSTVLDSKGISLKLNESKIPTTSYRFQAFHQPNINMFTLEETYYQRSQTEYYHQCFNLKTSIPFHTHNWNYLDHLEETAIFPGSAVCRFLIDFESRLFKLFKLFGEHLEYQKENLHNLYSEKLYCKVIPDILKVWFANSICASSETIMAEKKNLAHVALSEISSKTLVAGGIYSENKSKNDEIKFPCSSSLSSSPSNCFDRDDDVIFSEDASETNNDHKVEVSIPNSKKGSETKPKDLQYILFERKSSHKKGRPSSRKQKMRQREKKKKKTFSANESSSIPCQQMSQQCTSILSQNYGLNSVQIHCHELVSNQDISNGFSTHSSLPLNETYCDPIVRVTLNSCLPLDDGDDFIDFSDDRDNGFQESFSNMTGSKFFLSVDESETESDDNDSDDDWDTVSTVDLTADDDELLSMFSTGLYICGTENGSIHGKTSSHEELSLNKRVSRIEEINAKWNRHYEHQCDDSENDDSKVSFTEDPPEVLYVERWIGNPLDKERFKRRLDECEAVIVPVLSVSHRQKVWKMHSNNHV